MVGILTPPLRERTQGFLRKEPAAQMIYKRTTNSPLLGGVAQPGWVVSATHTSRPPQNKSVGQA